MCAHELEIMWLIFWFLFFFDGNGFWWRRFHVWLITFSLVFDNLLKGKKGEGVLKDYKYFCKNNEKIREFYMVSRSVPCQKLFWSISMFRSSKWLPFKDQSRLHICPELPGFPLLSHAINFGFSPFIAFYLYHFLTAFAESSFGPRNFPT